MTSKFSSSDNLISYGTSAQFVNMTSSPSSGKNVVIFKCIWIKESVVCSISFSTKSIRIGGRIETLNNQNKILAQRNNDEIFYNESYTWIYNKNITYSWLKVVVWRLWHESSDVDFSRTSMWCKLSFIVYGGKFIIIHTVAVCFRSTLGL